MRRIPRWVRLSPLISACVLAAGCPTSCSDLQKTIDGLPKIQSVTVTPATAQLAVGQTQQFTAAVVPPDTF